MRATCGLLVDTCLLPVSAGLSPVSSTAGTCLGGASVRSAVSFSPLGPDAQAVPSSQGSNQWTPLSSPFHLDSPGVAGEAGWTGGVKRDASFGQGRWIERTTQPSLTMTRNATPDVQAEFLLFEEFELTFWSKRPFSENLCQVCGYSSWSRLSRLRNTGPLDGDCTGRKRQEAQLHMFHFAGFLSPMWGSAFSTTDESNGPANFSSTDDEVNPPTPAPGTLGDNTALSETCVSALGEPPSSVLSTDPLLLDVACTSSSDEPEFKIPEVMGSSAGATPGSSSPSTSAGRRRQRQLSADSRDRIRRTVETSASAPSSPQVTRSRVKFTPDVVWVAFWQS